jgi:hypothetical protein
MARDASPDEHVIVDEEIEDTDVVSSEAEDSESEDEPTSGENADPAEDSEPDPLPDESGQQEEPDDEAATAGQAPAAAASTGTKKSEPQPFTFKGDKTEHTLEGAHYYAGDGLYVPEAQVPRLKQLLSSGAIHQGSWQKREREFERTVKSLREERNEKDVAADAVMDLVFKDLANAKTEDEIIDWALNFKKSIPEYRVAIREKQLEARERRIEERGRPSPEDVEEQIGEVAAAELDRTLEEIFKRPEIKKLLDDADRAELKSRFSRNPRRFVSAADRDDPDLGVKKGELLFDGAAILEQVELAATLKGRAVTASQAAASAAATNRKRVGAPAAAVRRTPAPARSSGASDSDTPRDKRTGRFKSKEEYEAWIASGEE